MFVNGHVRTIPAPPEPAAPPAPASSPPWWFQGACVAGAMILFPAVGIGFVAYVGVCIRVLRLTGGF